MLVECLKFKAAYSLQYWSKVYVCVAAMLVCTQTRRHSGCYWMLVAGALLDYCWPSGCWRSAGATLFRCFFIAIVLIPGTRYQQLFLFSEHSLSSLSSLLAVSRLASRAGLRTVSEQTRSVFSVLVSVSGLGTRQRNVTLVLLWSPVSSRSSFSLTGVFHPCSIIIITKEYFRLLTHRPHSFLRTVVELLFVVDPSTSGIVSSISVVYYWYVIIAV